MSGDVPSGVKSMATKILLQETILAAGPGGNGQQSGKVRTGSYMRDSGHAR